MYAYVCFFSQILHYVILDVFFGTSPGIVIACCLGTNYNNGIVVWIKGWWSRWLWWWRNLWCWLYWWRQYSELFFYSPNQFCSFGWCYWKYCNYSFMVILINNLFCYLEKLCQYSSTIYCLLCWMWNLYCLFEFINCSFAFVQVSHQ